VTGSSENIILVLLVVHLKVFGKEYEENEFLTNIFAIHQANRAEENHFQRIYFLNYWSDRI